MEYWRKRAASGAAEQESVLFLAEEAGGWVGIVGGFLEEEEGGRSVELVSMWVNPAYRGRRLGQRLVEQIIDWARQRGARRVTLWVTENNAGAISLYRRCGFRSTGETQELPSNPTLRELRMVVSLDDECPHQAR
jgi:ribosomal protein S18 acetylase RimI-like enzyme